MRTMEELHENYGGTSKQKVNNVDFGQDLRRHNLIKCGPLLPYRAAVSSETFFVHLLDLTRKNLKLQQKVFTETFQGALQKLFPKKFLGLKGIQLEDEKTVL